MLRVMSFARPESRTFSLDHIDRLFQSKYKCFVSQLNHRYQDYLIGI